MKTATVSKPAVKACGFIRKTVALVTAAIVSIAACVVPDNDPANTSCVPLMDDDNPDNYACFCANCPGGQGCCGTTISNKVSGTILSYRGTRQNVKTADEDGTDTSQIVASSCRFEITYICGGQTITAWVTPEHPEYQDEIPAGQPCKKQG